MGHLPVGDREVLGGPAGLDPVLPGGERRGEHVAVLLGRPGLEVDELPRCPEVGHRELPVVDHGFGHRVSIPSGSVEPCEPGGMSAVAVPRVVSAPIVLLGATCLGFGALTGLAFGLMGLPDLGVAGFVVVGILLPAVGTSAGGATLLSSGHRWAAAGVWLGTLVAVAGVGLFTLWNYGMQTSGM
jgi:hypothetical protein